jgi:hypothetical protein
MEYLMAISRGLAIVGGLCCAAILSASPACADPLAGTYTAVISGKNGAVATQTWVFTPCGAGCVSLSIGEGAPPRQLHQEGNAWTWSQNSDGVPCATTIDSTSLAGTTGCSFMAMPVQLSKA